MGMSSNLTGFGDDDEGDYRPIAEINITPMVDVMLVLLIVFMVAAPLMVAGVPVELPKTSAAKLGKAKKPMVVTMAPDGKLYIRDEEVSPDRLVSKLIEMRHTEGETVVYVRADKNSAYGDVMAILGRVGESGYGRVSLLSHPRPGQSLLSGGNK